MAGRAWQSSGDLAVGTAESLKATAGVVKSVILNFTTAASYVTVMDGTTVKIRLSADAATALGCKVWSGGPVDFPNNINYTVNGTGATANIFYQ